MFARAPEQGEAWWHPVRVAAFSQMLEFPSEHLHRKGRVGARLGMPFPAAREMRAREEVARS